MIFIEFAKLTWDIIKYTLPVANRLVRSRKIRSRFSLKSRPHGTPAHDIGLLIAALEDPNLWVDQTDFVPLLDIKRSLWKARMKLLDLMDYNVAARGRDTSETRSAMSHIFAKWELDDARPLFHTVIKNPETDDEIRKLAEWYLSKL